MCVARPKKVKGTNKLSFVHTIQNLLKEPMKQEEALAKVWFEEKSTPTATHAEWAPNTRPSGHRTRGRVGTEHEAERAPNTRPSWHQTRGQSTVAFT